jgi:pentatricopeptide repeat protein
MKILLLQLLFLLLAVAQSYLYRRQRTPHVSRCSIFVQRSNFNLLIERCKQTGIYTPAVEAAMAWLNEDSLTSSGLTSVIQIFGLASMVDDAVTSLEKARQKGLTLNHYHYNACINACKSHKRYDLAMQTFSKMKSENIKPTVQTLSIVISICSVTGDWNKAYELFSSVPAGNRDAKLYTSILLACDKAGNADLSLQLWQEMKARGSEVCTSQSLNTVSER